MPALDSSSRTLLKATHTGIVIPHDDSQRLGRVLEKSAYLSSLSLQDGEVAAVAQNHADELDETLLTVVSQYEAAQMKAIPPDRTRLTALERGDLLDFGRAVVAWRGRSATAVARPDAGNRHEAPTVVEVAVERPVALREAALVPSEPSPAVLAYLARQAVDTFSRSVAVSPIGLLHLERVEMAPAGLERGELLATIPLAPGETTAVEQKEWSVTEEDLSTIVTDSLEEYTERGVTEKSELAQASTSETKRSQQLGLSSSVSGSYGVVTFSASANFTSALEAADSKKDSRSEAKELTSKASSRVRKERKVTIQTKTVTGSEETTTRQLTNTSPTDALRIDYFSLMRKWRVRLFQYGLRQTYDIAIPSPGAALRDPLLQIASLTAQIEAPFQFPVTVDEITRNTYRQLAITWSAAVPDPPAQTLNTRVGGQIDGLDGGTSWHFKSIPIDIPDGYQISDVWLDALLGNVDNDQPAARAFAIFGYGAPRKDSHGNPTPNSLGENGRASFVEHLSAEAGFMVGAQGHQTIELFIQNINAASVTFALGYTPTDAAWSHWQFTVWQALQSAASDAHYAKVQSLSAQRQALIDSISALDTLTLRREERDEIVRNVLHWLLGPEFRFMPDEVVALFTSGELSLSSNDLGITDAQWELMFRYQEMIKFVHQAIEWENLLYFLYPYFWDVPAAWPIVRTLQHPDPERQQFLRAGSARVVVTVRPGFEEAFAQFVDLGSFGTVLPPNHPYLTIGQEIAAYDRTNYPGVPPANPTQDYRSLLSPESRSAWTEMTALMAELDDYRNNHGGRYPTTAEGLAELGNPVPLDPWGHDYVYTSPGRYTDYELSTAGPDGISGPDADGNDDDITSWAAASLIGEWFEYTPSRGTDIAVNSVLAQLA